MMFGRMVKFAIALTLLINVSGVLQFAHHAISHGNHGPESRHVCNHDHSHAHHEQDQAPAPEPGEDESECHLCIALAHWTGVTEARTALVHVGDSSWQSRQEVVLSIWSSSSPNIHGVRGPPSII